MVDIVDVGLRVDQLDQIFDDRDHILAGQHSDFVRNVEIQFFIDSETTYITQVVTFVREEEFLDDVTGSCLIGWFRVTQLAVDVNYGLFL